jgi:hypothetical protein
MRSFWQQRVTMCFAHSLQLLRGMQGLARDHGVRTRGSCGNAARLPSCGVGLWRQPVCKDTRQWCTLSLVTHQHVLDSTARVCPHRTQHDTGGSRTHWQHVQLRGVRDAEPPMDRLRTGHSLHTVHSEVRASVQHTAPSAHRAQQRLVSPTSTAHQSASISSARNAAFSARRCNRASATSASQMHDACRENFPLNTRACSHTSSAQRCRLLVG